MGTFKDIPYIEPEGFKVDDGDIDSRVWGAWGEGDAKKYLALSKDTEEEIAVLLKTWNDFMHSGRLDEAEAVMEKVKPLDRMRMQISESVKRERIGRIIEEMGGDIPKMERTLKVCIGAFAFQNRARRMELESLGISKQTAPLVFKKYKETEAPAAYEALLHNLWRPFGGIEQYMEYLHKTDIKAFGRVEEFAAAALSESVKAGNMTKAFREEMKKLLPEDAGTLEPVPLPKMPKRPQRYVSPNDKLMDALTEKEIINDAGGVNLSVLPKKGIESYVMAVYEPDTGKDPFNLSPEERNIMDAVCSIWQQAKTDGHEYATITPASIYKAMPGGGVKPTAEAQQKIEELVDKMRHTYIKLNATKHLLEIGSIKPGEKFAIEDYIINARKGTYERKNGTVTAGWIVAAKPLAYEYAERTGQLVNVSAKVVRIEGVDNGKPDKVPVKMNESRRSLLAYLLRRVAVIKHAREKAAKKATWKKNAEKTWQELMEQSTTILFSSAFDAARIDTARTSTVAGLRDFCLDVMKYWKSIGYIPGFKELMDGRQRRGIKILFD